MGLRFVKTHAYGNDFLLVYAKDVIGLDAAELARDVCDRHRGLGADGLLVITEQPNGAAMRLWNADGSPSEVSGNGVRCLGAWLATLRHLEIGDEIVIETDAGAKRLKLLDRADSRLTFRTAMGQPDAIEKISLDVLGERIEAVTLSVGNPHCVVLGAATHERLVRLGPWLATHPHFPDGTNVEFVHVERPDRLQLLIWERGVGPTESSGTGTCAAAVAAATFGGALRSVEVVAPGGTQRVDWRESGIELLGWATVVAKMDWLELSAPTMRPTP